MPDFKTYLSSNYYVSSPGTHELTEQSPCSTYVLFGGGRTGMH